MASMKEGGEEGGRGNGTPLLADIYGLQQPLSGAAVRIGAGYSYYDDVYINTNFKSTPSMLVTALRRFCLPVFFLTSSCFAFIPTSSGGTERIEMTHLLIIERLELIILLLYRIPCLSSRRRVLREGRGRGGDGEEAMRVKNDLPTLFYLSLFSSPGLLIISWLVLARYRMNAWLYDPIARPITDHHDDGEERSEANPRGSTRRGQGGGEDRRRAGVRSTGGGYRKPHGPTTNATAPLSFYNRKAHINTSTNPFHVLIDLVFFFTDILCLAGREEIYLSAIVPSGVNYQSCGRVRTRETARAIAIS
ncbi:hypothetical protein ALC53_04524 [Atta colombica]|uniref:Uncharacterized protein n=1 Tax=Atta colombica TaxID=520822 RepID=A0A195BKC6_9HYME|nr:hypothetical protein ALC53_04524 [Atta colombica]